MANEVRLIDANAAALNTHKEIYWTESEKAAVRNFLTHQPTIDPESLRPKGRWVIEKRHTVSQNAYMDDNYFASATCSECSFCIHAECASFGYPKLNTTNFCPNCGADMREG